MAKPIYDIFGDVHGQHLRLLRVLKKLGYTKSGGTFSKKGHKAIFLGDIVDRGRESAKVIALVKGMVEAGNAEMIMGNHEYNLWGYLNKNSKGEYYRPHSPKNELQVINTIRSYSGNMALLNEHIKWIETLPLYINKKRFRAIHACWDKEAIEVFKIGGGRRFNEDVLRQCYESKNGIKKAVKILISGTEIKLPPKYSFKDPEGTARTNIRNRWWEGPEGHTYRSYAVKTDTRIPKIPIKIKSKLKDRSYSKSAKPLFFGHYSMRGQPELLGSNLCCLDWVNKRNRIVVYRLGSESELSNKNLFYFY